MKDYLRALSALQRMCKLLQQGAQVNGSTVLYFIDEVIRNFKMQFGEKDSAAKVLRLLEEAKTAVNDNNQQLALLRIAQTDILL